MREDHVAGRGATPGPAREDRHEHTDDLASIQASDPIADLIARLAAAANAGWPVKLDGHAVRVRALPGGFAVARRP